MATIYGVSLKEYSFDYIHQVPESAIVCMGGKELGSWSRKDGRSEFRFDESVLRPAARKFSEYRETARPFRFRPIDKSLTLIEQLLISLVYLEEDEFMFTKYCEEAKYPILAVFEHKDPLDGSKRTDHMGMLEEGDPPLDGTLEGYVKQVRENGQGEDGPYIPLAIYLTADDFYI